ncbi:MAG: NAD(P)H-hydrate dehydratase [Planktotalea sp.]|uniref:NAD(P)H-hydrate dehydratase n=1 Tax=Planktotalea sp. TaxID=2029877 RepID=UPI003C70937F
MSELLTAAQIRTLEQRAIRAGEATGLDLMERAGRGVVEAIFEEWPSLRDRPARALVLCGPGNNGGDGFVIARLLAELGWTLDVYLLGDPATLTPDARENHRRWSKLGTTSPLSDDAIDGYFEEHPDTKFSVDAIFGTGLTRPFDSLKRVQMELNNWQAASRLGTAPHVISVDLPSGVCADSGRYLGTSGENPFDYAIMANLTVTFHRPKLGHYLSDGPPACGKLVRKDIGLGCAGVDAVHSIEAGPFMAHVLRKPVMGHKFSHGSALVLSGGLGKTGAARLAARAALRIGAGLVTLGVPAAAAPEVAAQITALMMTRIGDHEELRHALSDKRINAVCLGPGLGLERAKALVMEALSAAHKPAVVLDADALSCFEDDPEALFNALHKGCVLTPHMGEFTRLFPDLAAHLNGDALNGPAFSKVDAVRGAAMRAGCSVLLKGADTVIGDQSGKCGVHSAFGARAAPWLATAGAGDVLAGLITGLLSRGAAPFVAASLGAHLHVDCALAFGAGLIAEDLPEVLPQVISQHLNALS